MTTDQNEKKTQYAYPIKLDWMTVESRLMRAFDANGKNIFGVSHGWFRGTDFYFGDSAEKANWQEKSVRI